MSNDEYVHFGCAWIAPKGWRNFDASPTLRFERLPLIGMLYTKNHSRFPKNVEFGDIVKGLPIPIESCKGVYCSHVLEHLSLEDTRTALKNTYGLLKKGGVFRLVLPDLEYSIKTYINNTDADAAVFFMKETLLGQERRPHDLKGMVLSLLGNSNHLWMWDYKSIETELRNAGFLKIRRARFQDAADPFFRQVEESEKWENCLGVECIK